MVEKKLAYNLISEVNNVHLFFFYKVEFFNYIPLISLVHFELGSNVKGDHIRLGHKHSIMCNV